MTITGSSEKAGLQPHLRWAVHVQIGREFTAMFYDTWASRVKPNAHLIPGCSLRRYDPSGDAMALSGVLAQAGSDYAPCRVPLTNGADEPIGILELIPTPGPVSLSWIAGLAEGRVPLIDAAGIRHLHVIYVHANQVVDWLLTAPAGGAWKITGLPKGGPSWDKAGWIRGAFTTPGHVELRIASEQQADEGFRAEDCYGQIDVVVAPGVETPESIRHWIQSMPRPFVPSDFDCEIHSEAVLTDVVPGTLQRISTLLGEERPAAEELAIHLEHLAWRCRFHWQSWPASAVALESANYLVDVLAPRPPRQGRKLRAPEDYERLARSLLHAACRRSHSEGQARRAWLAREFRGWSLGDLGTHLGKSSQQVDSWESITNSRDIPPACRGPHAGALGVDAAWIETGSPDLDP